MEFRFSQEQLAVRDHALALAKRFDMAYWRRKDTEASFPEEFYRAVAKAGWLGIAMPEAFGGGGLGITEAAILMQAIAESGGGLSAASAVHMNIFGLNPVVVFGTEPQKQRMLPPLIRGEAKACFAVTEPTAGLDTGKITTKAIKKGDYYLLSGQKVWTSTAQVADFMLILARTTPLEEVKKPTQGLSLFYTKLDRNHVEVKKIEKMGRHAVDSNELFIDELPVPEEDRIGVEGQGFSYILHGMNPERILIAAEAVGIGRFALERAAEYAKTRVVFDRPIGQNQGVQHPLALCWAKLEAADLMAFKAASLYDLGLSCGAEANAAKLLASEAAIETCESAMLTYGGFGYAKEYPIERLLREVFITRLAPVTPQLILSYIAQKRLGLPKSYGKSSS